ncbi:hypothetical protein Egran_05177 [Elaphomyces granulatus]|uniref:Fungal-type protein kinase domain-containing protein n=1 Tax=Elaphomyces granulatus TaxID=519963 RepID=A0A232LSQ5_9EURO|nr:hypothetical protein Egran_05177 [Elaphomyces granulatus]
MSAIFGSYGLNLVFGDFKASTSTYTKVPDIVCTDLSGQLRFISEIKTPWVLDHFLQPAIEDEMDLRSVLGQIAMYLRETSLKYGFVSTYEETIFLRQELVAGNWGLQYSPVIGHSTSATVITPANFSGTVSLRQCFWHLSALARAGHVAMNTLPEAKWTTNRRRY